MSKQRHWMANKAEPVVQLAVSSPRRKLSWACTALLALLLLSSVAAADETSPEPMPVVGVAPHIGVIAPQPFSDLGSFPIFGLEADFIMPFDAGSMVRPLSLSLDVMFTAPRAEGSGSSADLGEEGAEYQWELIERMLILELGARWRFMPPGQGLSAFAHLGSRLYLMETILNANGNGGQDFGENREVGREFGFVVGGGVEYSVGPGAIFGALELTFSDLNKDITGDSNTGALVLDLGYRLFF